MKNCHKATAGARNISLVPNTTQHVLVLNIDETQILLQCSTICSLSIDSLYSEFPPYTKIEMQNEDPGQVQVQHTHSTQGFGKAPWILFGSRKECFLLQKSNPAAKWTQSWGMSGLDPSLLQNTLRCNLMSCVLKTKANEPLQTSKSFPAQQILFSP